MSRYRLRVPSRCPHCGGVEPQEQRPLTARQSRIYTYIAEYIHLNGFAPSFEEIASAFEYASLATVHEHLANLEAKGWIRRTYAEARSVECLVPLTWLESPDAELVSATADIAQLTDSQIENALGHSGREG